jgi:hypothetical protein
MDSPLDPQRYPHLFDLILSYLSRDQVLTLRNVSRGFRNHVDPQLLQHLVVGPFNAEHPVSFHSTDRRRIPLQWAMSPGVNNKRIAAQQGLLKQMRKHCVVLDVDCHRVMFEGERCRASLASLRSLPHLQVVRRFSASGFQPPVDTIIDFAVTSTAAAERPPNMRCNRYIVPFLTSQEYIDASGEDLSSVSRFSDDTDVSDYDRGNETYSEAARAHHRALRNHTQHLEDVVLDGISGLEEVVLIFKRDSAGPSFIVDFLLRHAAMMSAHTLTDSAPRERAFMKSSSPTSRSSKLPMSSVVRSPFCPEASIVGRWGKRGTASKRGWMPA